MAFTGSPARASLLAASRMALDILLLPPLTSCMDRHSDVAVPDKSFNLNYITQLPLVNMSPYLLTGLMHQFGNLDGFRY